MHLRPLSVPLTAFLGNKPVRLKVLKVEDPKSVVYVVDFNSCRGEVSSSGIGLGRPEGGRGRVDAAAGR